MKNIKKSNYDTCMEMTRFVLMIFLMMMVAFESVCLIFLQLVSHAAMCRYICEPLSLWQSQKSISTVH